MVKKPILTFYVSLEDGGELSKIGIEKNSLSELLEDFQGTCRIDTRIGEQNEDNFVKICWPIAIMGKQFTETRHTDYYPSKSAIIGLILASLGYRRDEDDKIKQVQKRSGFATTWINKRKSITRLSHCKKYKDNGEFETYVTNRYY